MKHFIPALKIYFFMSLILGLIYPAMITVFGQTFFSKQSNGSLIEINGKIIGSELIGQKFEGEGYFWPRPSATDFNAIPSGGSNLGPTSRALKEAVLARQGKLGAMAPKSLLFASGSGLDPELDLEGVNYQIPRVSKARGVPQEILRSMVAANTEKRMLGFIGEERVNILKLNLALDKQR